ncbi:MAG: methyltransferase domain-containing protein [Proteobacteria bacterium]|nr:methyltransferase domain-containing protein [Pseudomonadota bacterium]MDA1310686.1 methyltransferase domain-containing protein [Pseudomonadota bacterium]
MAGADWQADGREAGALLKAGRAEEAARLYQRIAQVHPRRPDAHNNLAVALKAAGRTKEAVESYRRAIKLDAGYGMARKNLARALRQLGRHEEAISHLAMLSRDNPSDRDVQSETIDTLIEMDFAKPSPVAHKALLDLFQRRDIDLQRLVGPAMRLVLVNRRFARLISTASEAYPDRIPGRPLTPREIADPLLIALLTWTIVPSPEIEAWITLARRQLLTLAGTGQAITSDPALLWAIAAQCQVSEHAQTVTPAEQIAAAALSARLTGDDPAGLAVAGMYLPLGVLPAARALWQRLSVEPDDRSPMRALLKRAVADPIAERRIASTLPTLTAVEDRTSLAVQDQYETSPYPKWLSIDRDRQPRSLADRLAQRFPALATQGLDLTTPRILVAGCGTGRHAITTAGRYKDCTVLAVDISRVSLAFALRQAEAYGQENITFARADILKLASLEDRFDLIECSGVLHHMADPVAGWRVLRGLVKPGGLMRIGLYSAHARQRWESLRAPVPDGADREQTNDFLRQKRAGLLTDPPTGPESVVLRIADFYSLSGCRDLLFHAREVQFTLPEIAAALADLDLEFVGFETLPEPVNEAFRQRFAKPGSERDLSLWDAFERDNPDTFIAMYQFWCQAKP